MGRNNKKYKKDLHQQAYDRLTGMQAFGMSKKEAMESGTSHDKIFSYETYKTYWKHTKYFIKWVHENYPEIKTLKKAEKYVSEWLQFRVDQGLSAWTIHTEEAALNKLYQITPDAPNRFQAPKRERAEIKRSRVSAKRDTHFSITNNDELIKFCQGTGLRRSELSNLKGGDLLTRTDIEDKISVLLEQQRKRDLEPYEEKQLSVLKDTRMFKGEFFVYVRNGKGGRARMSPIIGPYSAQIIERMQNTGLDEKVWNFVNSNADIHGYRAEYATAIYKNHARNIKDIPYDRMNKGTGKMFQSDVYTCRKDEAGKKLDKAAMLICSKALGHNRISVVADNYIRGL